MKKLFNILTLFVLFTSSVNAKEVEFESDDGNIVLFKIDGTEECIARKNIKVFQADGKFGLACEVGNNCNYTGNGIMYILTDHQLYDGEIIKNPSGKCAKQVGVLRYKSTVKYDDGNYRYITVPIIEILNK